MSILFQTNILNSFIIFYIIIATVELSHSASKHKIPSYIKICKRNDPHVEECILNSVEQLRPRLVNGIPELDVPALEPLTLPEVVVSRGGNFRAVGTNVIVRGASNFKVTKLKVDLKKNIFYIGIEIPHLTFDAQYDVNARILVVPVKGKGPIKANATDVVGDVVLKARKVKREGETYIEFKSIDIDLKIENYSVRLENLFNGDKALGDAVNVALNENKKDFMKALKPIVEKVVGEIVLDIANKITKNFTYDELFPKE
ncbi:protein takeout-like [Lycorma delicatula]|uniref:protein takeout-like n=1 Tax=Lycorma delicatula TaxID=130591 RepID=UPI003F50E26D